MQIKPSRSALARSAHSPSASLPITTFNMDAPRPKAGSFPSFDLEQGGSNESAGHAPALGGIHCQDGQAGLKTHCDRRVCHYYRLLVGGETGLIHDAEILRSSREKSPGPPSWPLHGGGPARVGPDGTHRAERRAGNVDGLIGPKSLLKVKQGLSFLEIILRQAELSRSRLALMNSFNTHAMSFRKSRN